MNLGLRRVCFVKGLLFLLLCLPVTSSWANDKALPYKRLLIGYATSEFGANAPFALLAAQVEQESGWNPLARSKYACGLTQFTPDTSVWISQKFRVSVGEGSCLNPAWALRAQSAYMNHLAKQGGTRGLLECDTWKFALWGYNGGLGWVIRDKTKASLQGLNALDAEAVRGVNAGRGLEFFKENRGYDVGIINKRQPKYLEWGGSYICGVIK